MTSFFTHRKTARLQLKLGSDAFWIPPRLWAYCADNQPDGDLSGYRPEEISMLIGYSKDACSMLEALKDSGFIDPDMKIHGWKDHNRYHEAFSKRAKTAAAARWSKEKPPQTPQKKVQSGRKTVDIDSGVSIAQALLKHCSSIYDLYPKRCARPLAIKSIEKQIKKHGFELVRDATARFAEAWKGAESLEYCPNPTTWFNQERFNDMPETWRPHTNGNIQTSNGKNISRPDHAAGF